MDRLGGLLCLIVAAASGAAGCFSGFTREEDGEFQALLERPGTPLDFRAGLALPRWTAAPAGESGHRLPLPPDLDSLGSELAAVLETTRLFKSLVPLPRAEGKDGKAPLQEAWEKKIDVLLDVELSSWDVVFRGTNWLYFPGLLLWFQFMFPAWFLPDEDYAVEMAAEIVATSPHTGKVLFRRSFKAEFLRSLDDFQRGWILFGSFRVPGALSRTNFEKVLEHLGGSAREKFLARFAVAADEAMRSAAARPDFAALLRKKIAVVAGLQNYRHHRIPRARFARDDAREFHDFLVSPKGGGLPERNVVLLSDETATRAALEEALREAADRARPGDELVFYFAGNGALAAPSGKKPASAAPARLLLPYDADPEAIQRSSLSLSAVLDLLGACPASSVAIIDASFKTGGGERSYHDPAGKIRGAPASPPVPPGVSLLCSCSDGQECGGLEDRGRSFFSWFLVEALRGEGDANGDGRVTLREAFGHARREVEVQAFVDGFAEQSPSAAGAPLDGISFPRR